MEILWIRRNAFASRLYHWKYGVNSIRRVGNRESFAKNGEDDADDDGDSCGNSDEAVDDINDDNGGDLEENVETTLCREFLRQ